MTHAYAGTIQRATCKSAGSTGAPKGVLCCHEGLVNAMDFETSMRQTCGLGKDDPVMQSMAVFADMSGEWQLHASAQSAVGGNCAKEYRVHRI
jgi:non-ribosomal peptide synthetase component F